MSQRDLPKEHVEALERILGVKLPESGFAVEVKALSADELSDGQLEGVAGGARASLSSTRMVLRLSGIRTVDAQQFSKNWAAKI